jgi:oxygen-independent coproporphyrinogen-3 oxidase
MDCADAALALRQTLAPGELSLYLGIPFCPSRCAYCSFISADVKGALALVESYVDALCREIQEAGRQLRANGLSIRTAYMGGGTPTTLTAGQLDRVLGAVEEHLPMDRCGEFTVEAGRPDTITAEKLEVLRRHGIHRISVNPQTMEDAVLRAMGRAHTAAQIREAMDLAAAHFGGLVNMDLIAGLPSDSLAGFSRTLDQVLALAPANLTVHTLALKKGARLAEERQDLCPPEEVAAMLDLAEQALRGAGYVPYYLYRQKYMSGSLENVGWCRPGTQCDYNIIMMEELQSVLSLGAGGITKLVDPATGAITRLSNPKFPREYLDSGDKLAADKETAARFQAALR